MKDSNIQLGKFERFKVKITKKFEDDDFYLMIEQVRDTLLKKEWYNVIWTNILTINILPRKTFKFVHLNKSKSYKSKKDAIQHFNKIIKTQLK